MHRRNLIRSESSKYFCIATSKLSVFGLIWPFQRTQVMYTKVDWLRRHASTANVRFDCWCIPHNYSHLTGSPYKRIKKETKINLPITACAFEKNTQFRFLFSISLSPSISLSFAVSTSWFNNLLVSHSLNFHFSIDVIDRYMYRIGHNTQLDNERKKSFIYLAVLHSFKFYITPILYGCNLLKSIFHSIFFACSFWLIENKNKSVAKNEVE